MTADLPTCLHAATASDPGARVPLIVDGAIVGSVARMHLQALQAWPKWFDLDPARGVTLTMPPYDRDLALADVHRALHAEGRLKGWRNETFPLFDPQTLAVLARIERAAARFWGALTFGAHATGFVADASGRPTHLWIAQRAWTKSTDPGLFDNLIGGGVADGQSPSEALVREGFEEAGLRPADLLPLRPAGVLRLWRDVPEGLQHEWLHCFDVELPPGCVPHNQDGEVAAFTLLPVQDALALAWDEGMTVDAALVTIDFAVRHQLLASPVVERAMQPLRIDPRHEG